MCTVMQALAAVSAQYRAVQQATADRVVEDLIARQASAPAEMLQAMIQGDAEHDLHVQAWVARRGRAIDPTQSCCGRDDPLAVSSSTTDTLTDAIA